MGGGDLTAEATVPAEASAVARITQKQPGVLYGIDMVRRVFLRLDPHASIRVLIDEGVWHDAPAAVMELSGNARALLSGERTALNFLGHLSGVATMAARAAREVQGTGAKVLDTRKTIPGLRSLEKAAVAAGGAYNHRHGLYDAILIKENHSTTAGGIANAVALARAHAPEFADTIEVEVRNPQEIDEALAAGARRLLLDNMDNDQLAAAVAQVAGRAELEASGGVTLQTLRERARTGVEWISMGALTHSAPALDLSLILEVTS